MKGKRWKILAACVGTALIPIVLLLLLANLGITDLLRAGRDTQAAMDEMGKRLAALETKEAETKELSDIQEAAVGVGKKLDDFLLSTVDGVNAAAKVPGVFGMDAASQRDEFEKQAAAHGEFESWYGYTVHLKGLTAFPDQPSFVGADQATNQDAKQALTSFRPVISDLRGRKTFSVYVPIVSAEGKPKGVLGADVKPSTLLGQFKEALDGGYVVFLVKRSEGKSSIMLTLPETTTAATTDKLGPTLGKITAGETSGGMKRKEDDGSFSLVGHAALTEASWSVGVIQPEAEYRERRKGAAAKAGASGKAASAFANAFALGNAWGLVGLGLLLLVIGLGFLFAYLLTRGETPAPAASTDGKESGTTVRRVIQERRVEHVEERHEEES